jgi:endo-1,4-beta-xylanase
MNYRLLTLHRSLGVIAFCFAALALVACTSPSSVGGEGGSGDNSAGEGGSPGTGGGATGGSSATGGSPGTGGLTSTGGVTGTGGAKGGTTGTGGITGTGGAKGGTTGTGGTPGTGGTTSTGGSTGGAGSSGTCTTGTLPSGGTMHTGDTQGTADGLTWQLWANGSGGSITTFSVPAFSAAWANSGDFLARIGLEWGNSGKAVSSLGTVTAQFAETKTGNAGGYSYIGIYGWSVNPCIEWYIVDDSFNTMPVNPGSTTNKGTVTIDGGSYILYTRPTTGTGGNRCGSSVTSWNQFYSVRKTARTCGQISISDHFSAWSAAGMTLGSVLEASILMEAGGGTGSIAFPTANVTAQ